MSEPTANPVSGKNESPGDKFWNTYLSVAREEDKFLPGSWEANTGGILTFTGLFAATVAAFLIESYKFLSPDSGDRTVFVLQQLLSATANISAQTPVTVATPGHFQAMPSVIAVNSLWFSSLLISLFCALLSTLIQEWARDYRRDVTRRRTLNESSRDRAYNHTYVRMGVDRYSMDQVVYLVTALVHLSVLLFAIGLIIFLFPIDKIVANVAIGVLGIFLVVYAVASALPLRDLSCPYRTPVTYLFAGLLWLFRYAFPSTVSTIWRRALPAAATLRDMTTRSIITDYDRFLTPVRFAFAWERTSRHMMHDEEQFWNLLKSLSSLIPENGRYRTSQLEYVWSDRRFFETLHKSFAGSSFKGSTHDPFTLQSFAGLFLGMIELVDTHGTARFHTSVNHFLDALRLVVHVSKNSHRSKEKLAAQLCIADMRNICIQDHKHVHLANGCSIDHMYELMSGWRHANLSPPLVPDPIINKSKELVGLIPLHDDSCCKSHDEYISSHAAASNALTVFANLLEADPAVRDSVEIPKWLEQLFYRFDRDSGFNKRVPSKQFIDVLCTAGLEKWLEPEDYIALAPNSASAHYVYLTGHGSLLVRGLNILASSVDWDGYHLSRTATHLRPQALSTPTQPVRATEPASPSEAAYLNSLRSLSTATPALRPVIIHDHNGVPEFASGHGFDRAAESQSHMGRAFANELDREQQADSSAARGSDVHAEESAAGRD